MAIICNTRELKHGTSTRKGREVALAYCCLWGNAFLMPRKGIVRYLIDSFSCFTLEAYLPMHEFITHVEHRQPMDKGEVNKVHLVLTQHYYVVHDLWPIQFCPSVQ